MNAERPIHPAPGDQVAFGVSEVERLLCAPAAAGVLNELLPRRIDAWAGEHPSLDVFAEYPKGRKPVRICIATEQITGPVRNGGIGTTYAHLAELLAKDGHDVTVLYLRGQQVEVETVEHWINWYAQKGVRFVPAPDYAEEDQFQSNANRWLRVPYNMMRYLIEHPMDVVHVSEWRGTGYLSLLAKRQGLAFADTLFAVKTSSPWMWNRLYGSHTLERGDDLVKVAAERQSVELADIVIGGSLHLLRWMASQGYAVPEGRAFVQPNVSTFTTLEPLMKSRTIAGGERTPIDEFVFFGRLESRKGLFVFCQTIRRLIRMGVKLPPKITFMGKPGGRMASHPDQTTPEYIQSISKDWPTQVSILTDFQQYEAIEYLLGGARLAVMPSIIENSSMAIYETAICGIPTIASNVGGNAELIHADDHAHVLCEPHPIALGDMLEQALRLGGMVPRPSFDNIANLETWRRFHRQLGGPLRKELLRRSAESWGVADNGTKTSDSVTAICLYFTGDSAGLQASLASIAAQRARPAEVLVAVDGESIGALEEARRLLAAYGFADTAIECFDLDAGRAFNLLASAARAEYLVFLWEGATLVPSAVATLERTARSSGAQLLTWLHRVKRIGEQESHLPLRGVVLCSSSDSFFRDDTGELPLFVARDVHSRLGGFTADYRVLGYDHEFAAAAQLAGVTCQTALIELGTVQSRATEWIRSQGYDLSASTFRVIRPKLAAAPLAVRDLLLFARGLQQRGPLLGARRPEDPVRKTESMLARMIAGISNDTALPGRQAASPAKVAAAPKRAANNAVTKPIRKVKGAGKPAITASMINGIASDLLDTATQPRKPTRKISVSPELQALLNRRSVVMEGDQAGQFLGYHEGRLYGWAVDLADPGSPLRIDVSSESRVIRAVADLHFADFARLPREARGHGFVIDMGDAAGRDSAAYELKVHESALMLASDDVRAGKPRLADFGIEGICDGNSIGQISGWAWYPQMPERRVDVAIYIEGAFFARLRADEVRDDPVHRATGRNDFGFKMEIPQSVRTSGRQRIDVVIADHGIALGSSPLVVTGDRIEISRPTNLLRFFRR